MNDRFHHRVNYESLYRRLCKEANVVVSECNSWSDFKLLNQINTLLCKLNLLTYSSEELELNLI